MALALLFRQRCVLFLLFYTETKFYSTKTLMQNCKLFKRVSIVAIDGSSTKTILEIFQADLLVQEKNRF